MAGSSPGTSVKPPSLGGERSGAREACPSPCNRGCAPLECSFELPKSIRISVHRVKEMKIGRTDEVGNKEENSTLSISDEGKMNNEYLKATPIDRDGKWGEDFKLSLSNFVRTISTSSQVEKVLISLQGASQKTSRALGECMKTISSLKSLHLEDIRSSELSVSDAEAIFSAFGPHSTLQTGGVEFCDYESTKAAIVKVLVDALLQNQVLCQFTLRYWGVYTYRYRLARKEWAGHDGSVMRELNRYLKSPTNVLTELYMYGVDDDEVIQLADTLGLNKKLQQLGIDRADDSSHREGIGRIGEALRTNTVLEKLVFGEETLGLVNLKLVIGMIDTFLRVEEMEALVGALVPDAASGIQPNTHLHTLEFESGALQGREGMEQLATLLRTNTSLLHLDLSNFFPLSSEYAEMLFIALRFNTSLESLDLTRCFGIGGKDVLGMIMDMLLHNRSLRWTELRGAWLDGDGDAEVVYAELRTRYPGGRGGLRDVAESGGRGSSVTLLVPLVTVRNHRSWMDGFRSNVTRFCLNLMRFCLNLMRFCSPSKTRFLFHRVIIMDRL